MQTLHSFWATAPDVTAIVLVQYVHQDCLQLWINEKGSKLCEICKQPYQVGTCSSTSSPFQLVWCPLTDVYLQGSYSDPPARTPVHAPNSALLAHLRRHGVVLRAVPVTDVNSLQQQDEAQVPTGKHASCALSDSSIICRTCAP